MGDRQASKDNIDWPLLYKSVDFFDRLDEFRISQEGIAFKNKNGINLLSQYISCAKKVSIEALEHLLSFPN